MGQLLHVHPGNHIADQHHCDSSEVGHKGGCLISVGQVKQLATSETVGHDACNHQGHADDE
ncbi:hypothetical protein [Bythopirellula goksoeyrii]|uniref:hypothetical protein n=1 Tax=Bythopirellula goksoeyrii TaxID=1400387 RepID=UPI0011CE0545|nr:hypothetical protein [Bythopirellula goksoeyrii]